MSGFAKFTTQKLIAVPHFVDDPRRDAFGGHLRLVVVAWDVARAWHQGVGLPWPRLLAAAVEEVRHVCVLLGLGDVQLLQPVLGNDLRQRVLDLHLAEHHVRVEVGRVAGHRRHVETVVEEQPRQLAAAVGAKVEEDHGVAGSNPWRSRRRRSAR